MKKLKIHNANTPETTPGFNIAVYLKRARFYTKITRVIQKEPKLQVVYEALKSSKFTRI